MDKKHIMGRIRSLRKHLNQTQEEFASAIGYDRSYISNVETGRAQITERLLKLIEQTFPVNPQWLREGKGEKLKGESIYEDIDPLQHDEQLQLFPLKIRGVWYPGQELKRHKKEGIVVIPIYNEADAGAAVRNYSSLEPIDWVPVKAKWLKDQIFGIKVKGDSMVPTIPDGSFVLVDGNQKDIVDGKIFVIEIPNIGATVKRVYTDYQKLILKPDNPLHHKEKVFPSNALEREEIRIIGRVVRVITEV
jgi:phage repressor protein C with HTH and peptisase S24 domain